MELKITEKVSIGTNHPCFIVAEIGQNHNGDLEIAKKLIDMSATCEVDAVKFVKRYIPSELTRDAYNKPYPCPQSFGETYGKHREFLELTVKQHKELADYAQQKGLIYFCTICDIESLRDMEKIDLPLYKIASRDITNLPLIEEIAKLNKPIILSTGLASIRDINDAVNIIKKYHNKFALLNCTSEYPAEYSHLHLRRMNTLKEKYNCVVGYSGHTVGIVMPVVAVALGASIIEKHITLARYMKGTDHSGSLEFQGLYRVVRDIRNLELALGEETLREKLEDFLLSTKNKLMRSLVSKQQIKKGQVITKEMLTLKSPGDGILWRDYLTIVGKKAKVDIEEDIQIKLDMIQDE
ncbi:MAG: N-acetylneuraminate synthase family protein [Candidatus Thorarchaeota archaeon]